MGIRAALAVPVAAALAACGGSDGTTRPDESTGWQAAQALGTTESYLGSLAGDGNGNAVVAWIPPPAADTGASIVARRFAPASGWGAVQTVAPPGPNIFQSPVAAMDTRGTALLVWPAVEGLFASRSADARWDTPRLISPDSSSFHALAAVGVSSPGTALVVWTGGSGSSTALSANRLDPALGWVSPETVWSIGARAVSEPALAVASTGFALATWAETREGGSRLWWTTFDPNRGWMVSQIVGLVGAPQLLYGVRAAVNAQGEGVLAWTQDDTVFASRYTTVEGPGVPQVLGRGGCQGLAIDAEGNALALLNQPLVPQAGLAVRVYRSSQGWDVTPNVVAETAGGVGALSMDLQGNAWVVWADAGRVQARRFVSGQGLQTAQPVAMGRAVSLPQVVAEAGGGALAAWLDRTSDSGAATILAARYRAP